MRFCLCIFESDTVKSDCPIQNFRKMMKYFCSRDIKKRQKSPEKDQPTGHFQSFFASSPDPKSENNPVNQLVKTVWPY